MKTLNREWTRLEPAVELKTLMGSTGPCLTVYMPLSNVPANQALKQNQLHWRECLKTIEPKLAAFGEEGRTLVESASDWGGIAEAAGLNNDPSDGAGRKVGEGKGRSIAVFCSADEARICFLDAEVSERAEIGPHFYIRPLIAELTTSNSFFLLALSQGNTRLLRCTTRSSEEVPLPAETKTTWAEYMNTAKPDHDRNNMGSAGPSSGTSKGIMQSTVTDREDWAEYMAHFFKQVDKGVGEVLRGRTEPLVLTAVEYEIPVYRSVNTYPHLCEETVHGAPDGLKGGDMHARALDALDRSYLQDIEKVLAEWNHKVGGRASSHLKDVVTAAHDGRVLTLLISDSQEKTGVFDEATNSVKGKETGTASDEDLVNAAAVQTILHAGRVMVVPQSKMPDGTALAAVFRY